MINDQNAHIWRRCFLAIVAIAFGFFVWSLFNMPSQDKYNPHERDIRQYGADSYTIPPPCVDAVTKANCEYTQSQVEQYTADRSDLAAQWSTADMTHLAFYAGLLGISLIVLTFFETHVAGGQMRKQNDIALNTSKAEFQPYLRFANEITLKGITDGMAEHSGRWLKISGDCVIQNNGKTPMMNGSYTSHSELTFVNSPMDFMKPVTLTDKHSHGCFDYRGSTDQAEFIAVSSFPTKKLGLVITEEHNWNTIDVRQARLDIIIRVMFRDGFSKNRTFEARYVGQLNNPVVELKYYKEINQEI